MMSAINRNARASRRSRMIDGNNPMYPPASGLIYPKKPRAKRGTVAAKKAKLEAFKKAMATQKRTGRSQRSFRPLSVSTEAYDTRKRGAARQRYAGRTDVIAKQLARAAAREQRFADASAKRVARALKRRRAAARGPVNVLTMSPGTIEAILGRRQRAGAGALARRMRNPAFATRYQKKMQGRRYRQGGRLLGATYKAPVEKRKTTLMARKQGGVGLRKGDIAGLVGMNTSLMRMGDYASKASLMDYAQMMRDKARAAYVARKRGMGMGSAVRTPMTKTQKKAKRAAAYKAKKAAMAGLTSPLTSVSNASSPMSSVGALSNIGSISAQFSPGPPPPRSRVTRGSVAASMAKQAAAARRSAIPKTNRRTRSMAPLRKSTRLMR